VIAALKDFTDRILGRGHAAITVPPFDGALKPNQILENAEVAAELEQPNDLTSHGGTLYIADGTNILRFADGGAQQPLRRFEREVTALCALPDGRLAVALDGHEVRIISATGAADQDIVITDADMTSVNALAHVPSGALLATDGSAEQPPARWAHDLMSHGATGRLLSIDIASKQIQVLASGLRYAFGVAASPDGALVSESWRHRLLSIGAKGTRAPLEHLPVYPSRLCPAAGGGYWLTAFTGRTQLVEFVLRENDYRRRMMEEIDPEFWVAPRLNSGNSFREPMQGAHLKTMGVIKPWAPPRSYGLVIRLNADCSPRYSLHSRVDGVNHSVVAVAETSDTLYVLAKGAGRLLRLPLKTIEAEFKA
jgi:sugar lactone lactonase YvrE